MLEEARSGGERMGRVPTGLVSGGARQLTAYATVAIVVLLARPWLPTFVAGCSLAAVGIALRIWGCGHLRKNRELTRSGPFAHVQHPLYLGTFLISVGAILAAGSPRLPGLLVWGVVGPGFLAAFFLDYLPRKRRIEASRLARRFGPRFEEWSRSVPVFVPRLEAYRSPKPRQWSWRVFRDNRELGLDLLITALFCAMFLLHTD